MVYVFKTSIKNDKDINQLSPYLNKILDISNWNFDLDDCDNILRVVSDKDIREEIFQLMKSLSFDCEELTD